MCVLDESRIERYMLGVAYFMLNYITKFTIMRKNLLCVSFQLYEPVSISFL